MACNQLVNKRRQGLQIVGVGITPTVPTAADPCSVGWVAATDIMLYEWAFNDDFDGAGALYIWTRNTAGIVQVYPEAGAVSAPVNSVQYNSAGAFAGDAAFTYDGTTLSLTDKLYVLAAQLANTNRVTITTGDNIGEFSLFDGMIIDYDGLSGLSMGDATGQGGSSNEAALSYFDSAASGGSGWLAAITVGLDGGVPRVSIAGQDLGTGDNGFIKVKPTEITLGSNNVVIDIDTTADTLKLFAKYFIENVTPNDGDILEYDSGTTTFKAVANPNAIEQIDIFIESPSVKTYTLRRFAKYAGTINDLTHIVGGGTSMTADIEINGTGVTGLTGLTINTVKTTTNATALNTFAVGDTIDLKVSAVTASPVDAALSLKITR